MRNLLEYPITDEEIIEHLERLATEIAQEELIGDLRETMLTLAIDRIRKNPAGPFYPKDLP